MAWQEAPTHRDTLALETSTLQNENPHKLHEEREIKQDSMSTAHLTQS